MKVFHQKKQSISKLLTQVQSCKDECTASYIAALARARCSHVANVLNGPPHVLNGPPNVLKAPNELQDWMSCRRSRWKSCECLQCAKWLQTVDWGSHKKELNGWAQWVAAARWWKNEYTKWIAGRSSECHQWATKDQLARMAITRFVIANFTPIYSK